MDVENLFKEFAKKRIIVLGDVMIDAYLRGKVTRVSPEAPVPIIELGKKEERLGGAANVALNLLALGATPILCAITGEDDGGRKFNQLLEKRALSAKGIVQSSSRKTTIKTRVIGNNQHLLRIDDEEIFAINDAEAKELIIRVNKLIIRGIDAIIIEDYNKGLLTPYVIQKVIALANENNVIVTVDPKKDNFFSYKNVTLFKPNLKELKEGLNCEFDFTTDRNSFENTIEKMESELNNEISFVTLSEHGVFIKRAAEKTYLPAHIRKISDVSGAGDTVIAVATLCLSCGLEANRIAEIANLSGGLVCELSGVVPIDMELLKKEVKNIV